MHLRQPVNNTENLYILNKNNTRRRIAMLTRVTGLGAVMVTASDLRLTGRGFDSQPFHYQVTTLGKLFTHMFLCHQAVQFGTCQTAVM